MTEASRRWYRCHKQEFSEKRKQRYREDPEYRRKALENAKRQRKCSPVPKDYEYSMAGAAQELGVSLFTIRRWKNNDFFPEPAKFNGKLYFKASQIVLLQGLVDFFDKGKKIKRYDSQLQALLAFIYSNWS